MAPPRMRFARQVLLLEIGVVVLVVGVGFALVGWLLYKNLTGQYKAQALAVAQSVAANPDIGDAVAAADSSGLVEIRAEAVRIRTGALFVVVTDRKGIRYAHPNPDEVGEVVRTLHDGDHPHAPKGQSPVTAKLVSDALREAPGPCSAAEIASGLGIARATAQRYLAALAQEGTATMSLRYGLTGRPEHQYEWRG